MMIEAIRQKFPEHSDLTDDQLLETVHREHYPDMQPGEFWFRCVGRLGPDERTDVAQDGEEPPTSPSVG